MIRTKINPFLCWVIGWTHFINAVVMILSLGFVSTNLVSSATFWAARIDSRKSVRQE